MSIEALKRFIKHVQFSKKHLKTFYDQILGWGALTSG
jgi:hypothetical protein